MSALVSSDILLDLSRQELTELKEIYRKVKDAFYVYMLIDLVLRWDEKTEDKHITITSPNNSWRQDGSIIVLLSFEMTGIFVYSLDKTHKHVREGLLKTKRINPSDPCFFLNVHNSYADIISDLAILNRTILINNENYIYSMSIEKAVDLEIKCPPGTYVKKLSKLHSEQINNVWPHKYPNSEKGVAQWIEKNIGYGLFLEKDDKLISWVLQGPLGHINLLQTEEEHKGNGYGKLMLQIIAQHIAQNQHTPPVATVLVQNVVSNSLFKKVGFVVVGLSSFIFTNGSNS